MAPACSDADQPSHERVDRAPNRRKAVFTSLLDPEPSGSGDGQARQAAGDRYYVYHAGRVVTVDLGTPRGVDNVDACCLMIGSFAWR